MRTDAREALRVRFDYRCAYCGVTEIDTGALLTIDHFQPRSRGGSDLLDNLVYCCRACNEIKGDFWNGEAEGEQDERRLLHPLDDALPSHITELADATLVGLTERGRFHIRRLRLNRPGLILNRRRRRRIEENILVRQQMIAQLQQLEDELKLLKSQVENWEL